MTVDICMCSLLNHRWSKPFGKWQVCERRCCRGYDRGIRRVDCWDGWQARVAIERRNS